MLIKLYGSDGEYFSRCEYVCIMPPKVMNNDSTKIQFIHTSTVSTI